jgi:hypothetical protein
MKVASILALVVVPMMMQAQMTPQYASYVSRTTDASNNLHQTVVVDGQTTGSCYFTYTCGQYGQQCQGTYPGCVGSVHTPSIYNVLKGVGGWSTGSGQDPFTYMSYQTTVTVNVPPGADQGGQWEGVVTCSGAGTISDTNGLVRTPSQHSYPNKPTSIPCWISQDYDSINHGKPHHAQDIDQNNNGQHTALPYGTPVYASESGHVDSVGAGNPSASYPACLSASAPANFVKIQNDTDHYFTVYAHVTPSVSKGQQVTAGQQIGVTDASGCQKGGHVHMARKDPNNKPVNFTVPCTYPSTSFWDGIADDNDPDTL